ncbi:hypothetical protein KGF54_004449 [Candida jiufengensis]|uniref:uncharacterized protein n=1 Tax=Candida jiufengensis TaxID=497108 RepID=UPI002223FE15|nr:uncharacterized protein KGF54_004449 [Candida jiufengensis]KAI5951375.1 hypothetical protein KGF54_004449 [Candida jiufengensis]
MAPHTAEADDLDDGLEYKVEISEDEGALIDSTNEENEKDQEDATTITPENPKKRKSESSLNFKEKKKMKMELDTEQKKNISTESNTEVITDFINSKINRKNSNLSALELSELYFTKDAIRSTSEYSKPRTLDNLSDYITQRFKNMLPGKESKKNKKTKKKGSKGKEEESESAPAEDRKFIAIVSMSAIRACDIHRATKDLNGSSIKLINKNKLDVDLKILKTTRSRILCCTPGRLQKILINDDPVLTKDEIKIIIVDNSYLDQKKQNIWDIKETVEVLKSLTKDGSKIYLY